MSNAGFLGAERYTASVRVSAAPPAIALQSTKDAWKLVIPKEYRGDEPLHLSFSSGDHLVIEIGEGSSVTFIEEHAMGPSKEWTHDVRLQVADRSQVTYVCLQELPASTQCTMRHAATVAAEAAITWNVATLGAATVDHQLRSEVIGDGGRSSVNWLFYAAREESQTLAVQNVFQAKNGSGEILMKGVAEDSGHAAARGLIEIGLGGSGTNTYLTQSVLMLDATAKVDAVPGLEIKTNDVKASHSASVARVSPEDLFYFASRGIPKTEARRMFVEGFLGEVAGRIGDQSAREAVFAALERKYAR